MRIVPECTMSGEIDVDPLIYASPDDLRRHSITKSEDHEPITTSFNNSLFGSPYVATDAGRTKLVSADARSLPAPRSIADGHGLMAQPPTTEPLSLARITSRKFCMESALETWG